jgi:hypothetical protein
LKLCLRNDGLKMKKLGWVRIISPTGSCHSPRSVVYEKPCQNSVKRWTGSAVAADHAMESTLSAPENALWL